MCTLLSCNGGEQPVCGRRLVSLITLIKIKLLNGIRAGSIATLVTSTDSSNCEVLRVWRRRVGYQCRISERTQWTRQSVRSAECANPFHVHHSRSANCS